MLPGVKEHVCQMLPQPEPDLGELRSVRHMALCCPTCAKPIPLVGRSKVIRHPLAQRLEDSSFGITAWWTLVVVLLFSFSIMSGGDVLGRGMGWMLMFLPAFPGFTIFFVVRCFPRYRVTACPYCGFSEVTRLR